ncbi:MAG: cell division protein ZapA [Gammaproteobacteria bacterium]|nr:cell division protein ZapA [Gammaproteobacteria bacterium]
MSTDKNNVTVRIMERDFNVKCPADKVHELHKAAKYLDGKIRDMRTSDKVLNLDSLMVITALNITHELMSQRKHNQSYMDTMSTQILGLQEDIEAALAAEG